MAAKYLLIGDNELNYDGRRSWRVTDGELAVIKLLIRAYLHGTPGLCWPTIRRLSLTSADRMSKIFKTKGKKMNSIFFGPDPLIVRVARGVFALDLPPGVIVKFMDTKRGDIELDENGEARGFLPPDDDDMDGAAVPAA